LQTIVTVNVLQMIITVESFADEMLEWIVLQTIVNVESFVVDCYGDMVCRRLLQ